MAAKFFVFVAAIACANAAAIAPYAAPSYGNPVLSTPALASPVVIGPSPTAIGAPGLPVSASLAAKSLANAAATALLTNLMGQNIDIRVNDGSVLGVGANGQSSSAGQSAPVLGNFGSPQGKAY